MERILQIGMTNNLGGIETYLMNYYRHIDKTKLQFDFVNIYDTDLCFADEIRKMGGKIYKVSNYYKHPIKYIKELVHIIRENDYKIIHCNMNSAVMLYPLIAAKKAHAQIIIAHSHNSSSDKGAVKSILHAINKHFIPLFANRFYACSSTAARWFFSKSIISSNRYKTIHNAIELDDYKYNEDYRKLYREELSAKPSTTVIGHVGRFVEQKNHKFLIDVFNELHKKHNDSVLVLIGQGPIENDIKERVHKYCLDDSVKFLGKRTDANKIYSAMDVFVLPSLYEGLPLVGVEAQVSGLPCLFSDRIDRDLAITKTCKFISIDDNKVWAENILNLMDNKRNCDYVKRYDINIAAEELLNIYMREIGGNNENKRIN